MNRASLIAPKHAAPSIAPHHEDGSVLPLVPVEGILGYQGEHFAVFIAQCAYRVDVAAAEAITHTIESCARRTKSGSRLASRFIALSNCGAGRCRGAPFRGDEHLTSRVHLLFACLRVADAYHHTTSRRTNLSAQLVESNRHLRRLWNLPHIEILVSGEHHPARRVGDTRVDDRVGK